MRFRALAAFVVLVAAACGGSDGGTTTPTKVVTRVTVTGATTTINPGESAQLSAAAFDNTGAQVSNPSFAWSSSATSIATVDQTGKVAGISAGTAVITASASGVQGTLSMKVNPAVTAAKDTIFTLPAQWTPAFVTINLGQSVVFTFGGGIQHNAIFSKFNVAGSPADIGNFTNQSFTRTFNARGKFPFECTLHAGMVGEITVQ